MLVPSGSGVGSDSGGRTSASRIVAGLTSTQLDDGAQVLLELLPGGYQLGLGREELRILEDVEHVLLSE